MSKNKKKKSAERPLTRWVYFTKTLYHDPASTTEFTYGKTIYAKSEKLQQIEADNKRINTLLLLALFVMFYIGAQFQNMMVFLLYLILVVAGQGLRILHLPKDITAHLTDTGRRKR
jgi:hypothetical protein